MAGYIEGPARWVPQLREPTFSFKHANMQTTIKDLRRVIDDENDFDKQVSIKVQTCGRQIDKYDVHLGAIKAIPSILATAATTPDFSLTIDLGIVALGDLADGSISSTAAWKIFRYYLMEGALNTARFVPKRTPFIPSCRSASGRYNFEIQATCLLLAKRLGATTFLELVEMEMSREFLGRQLIQRDFDIIEKVNDPGLDAFIIKWVTTKTGKPSQPAPAMRKSLEDQLHHCTYVRNLLNIHVLEDRMTSLRNPQVAKIIKNANAKAQALPAAATIPPQVSASETTTSPPAYPTATTAEAPEPPQNGTAQFLSPTGPSTANESGQRKKRKAKRKAT